LSQAYKLEARLYKHSALVSGQTQGICKDIQKRFPSVQTYWLPNGVDLNTFDPSKVEAIGWKAKNKLNASDFIVLYAGIIGIAQGLEIILKAAQHLKENSAIKFVLLGSGPEKERLIVLKQEMKLENVVFIDGVSKNEMRGVLKEVNAAVIPLRKLDLFLGAIPSKIFENLAMKVPVILNVDGEARDLFVTQGKCALYVEPGNDKALAETTQQLFNDKNLQKQLGEAGRVYASEYFNRNSIAQKFYEKLQKL
jgi:glycosyltransferase involved in cell wall biosynthesis